MTYIGGLLEREFIINKRLSTLYEQLEAIDPYKADTLGGFGSLCDKRDAIQDEIDLLEERLAHISAEIFILSRSAGG